MKKIRIFTSQCSGRVLVREVEGLSVYQLGLSAEAKHQPKKKLEANMKTVRIKLLRIIIFYLIALLFSFYFRIQPPEWYNRLQLPYGLSMLKGWLGGAGPFLGALIVIWAFKLKRTTTFFGSSKPKSIIMAVVPILLFTIIGAENDINLSPHLYGFLLGLTLTVYCILEETGWRGYLQDELSNVKPLLQYLIIGLLWYAWHLSFLSRNPNIINQLRYLVILLTGSIGIGYAVQNTRSIIVASCMHMIGNILIFSGFIDQHISFEKRLIVLAVSIFVWIIILITWDRGKTVNEEGKESRIRRMEKRIGANEEDSEE